MRRIKTSFEDGIKNSVVTLMMCLVLLLSGCVVFGPVRHISGPVAGAPQSSKAVVSKAQAPKPQVPRDEEVVLFGSMPAASQVLAVTMSSTPQIQHTWGETGSDFDPNVDPTGRRLTFASTRHAEAPDIYMKSVDGATVTQLTTDAAADIQPVFSPDGEQIAFASRRSGNWDIWVMNLADGRTSQITRTDTAELSPSWSPDGRRMAYCRWGAQSHAWELWIASLEMEGPAQFIGYGMYPRWSPTEDTLLFQRPRRRGEPLFSIWMMDMHNGEPGYATEIAASDTAGYILPSWSKDGYRIAYCAVELGSGEVSADGRVRSGESVIWMVNRDGRGRVRVTDGVGAGYSPSWSSDGRLYFSSNRGGPENIWSVLPRVPGMTEGERITRAGSGLVIELDGG